MAKAILPVLNVIHPELPETIPRASQLGLIQKCQRAWGWLKGFVKESAEFAGAHILSLVRAHYPLIDLSRLEAGYPQGYTWESATELRAIHMELSANLTRDLKLCGELPPAVQGPIGSPSTTHPATPSFSSRLAGPAVSTSQTVLAPSSSV